MSSHLPKFRNLAPRLNISSPISSSIRKEINTIISKPPQIPSVIGGQKYNTFNNTQYAGQEVVAVYNQPTKQQVLDGLYNYREAKESWNKIKLPDRLDIFLDAADKIEYEYYDRMMAATILGQNKTPYEAEIDSICELADFLRFNVSYVYELHQKQPITNLVETVENVDYRISNYSEYLPLPGFIASITPFNFTAIGGNLAITPLMLGNSVFWKPSDNAILSNYLIYEILEECGLPPGILNFIPYDGEEFVDIVAKNKDLSAIVFTGSSQVFEGIIQKVGNNISHFSNFPRLIGETGGKNYHFVHPSMRDDVEWIARKTFESAFGYSGQKCSACSRLYLPDFMVDQFLELVREHIKNHLIEHRGNYGLINEKSWLKSKDTISKIEKLQYAKIVEGGNFIENKYMMEPTIVLAENHNNFLFSEEFFAPLLSVYPYSENKLDETLDLCKNATQYGLTGSVFSREEEFINHFSDYMNATCGNFYINDKSTGSVVGQQPFGGGGKSGTNDKAGDINFIYRLTSQKNVKRCHL